MKIPFSSHTNHISSAPKPYVARGCCTGQCRHEICPSSHRMCCLNARPTFSRFLRKQITQNIFLQINNITLSKILKEMRHPSIAEPGEEGEQCQEHGLWNLPRMRRIHKNLQDKAEVINTSSNPSPTYFWWIFAKFLILLSPWPLLNTEQLWMGNQRVVPSILIFFFHLVNCTHKLKDSDPKIQLENFNLARKWSS